MNGKQAGKRDTKQAAVCVCHRTCNESINFCLESEWVFATYSPNPTHRRNISIHRSSQQPVGIQNDLWTKILDNNATIEVYTALSYNKKRRDNFHRIDNRKVKFLCVKTSIGLCISTKKSRDKNKRIAKKIVSELRDYDDISTNKYISNKRTIPTYHRNGGENILFFIFLLARWEYHWTRRQKGEKCEFFCIGYVQIRWL